MLLRGAFPFGYKGPLSASVAGRPSFERGRNASSIDAFQFSAACRRRLRDGNRHAASGNMCANGTRIDSLASCRLRSLRFGANTLVPFFDSVPFGPTSDEGPKGTSMCGCTRELKRFWCPPMVLAQHRSDSVSTAQPVAPR